MTDARREDQDRIVGQPIKATRVGPCAAYPICEDKILIDQDIVEVSGGWVHAGEPGAVWTCKDDFDVLLAETAEGRAL